MNESGLIYFIWRVHLKVQKFFQTSTQHKWASINIAHSKLNHAINWIGCQLLQSLTAFWDWILFSQFLLSLYFHFHSWVLLLLPVCWWFSFCRVMVACFVVVVVVVSGLSLLDEIVPVHLQNLPNFLQLRHTYLQVKQCINSTYTGNY